MKIGEIILRFFFGFLIPFIVINGFILFLFIQTPKVQVVDSNSNDYDETKIKFTISCLLPISDVKTYYQETEIPYSKLGAYYIIDANDNGTYQIRVTSLNMATVNSYVDIEFRDSEPPTINSSDATITGDTLTFTVQDSQSEINYDNLYGTYEDSTTISPVYIDKASGTVQFKIDSTKKITIHVEDIEGNYSETSFNPS